MNAPSIADAAAAQKFVPALSLALLAVLLSLGWFWLDGDVGLNLAEEGYLWYGVEAVARGEVPIRDFQAYDPGRYLWGAAWRRVLGSDLVSLRLSCVFFQCLGVTAGLLAAWRLSRHWLFLLTTGVLLCVWMQPRSQCFEPSIALMAVYAGVLLLERSTLQRHLGAGIFTGLMAVMGRNHGVYCVVAFALLIALASQGRGIRGWFAGSFAWLLGIVAGYLPQLLMLKVVPGYWAEFQQHLIGILATGGALPATVPWPWRVELALPGWTGIATLLMGCWFIVLPAFLALALVRVFRLTVDELSYQRVLAAATCVTLPYAHLAFSRPDLVHLGHAMPTLVLGLLAATFATSATWLWKIAAPGLLVVSLLTNVSEIGLGKKLLTPPGGFQAITVRGREMIVGSSEVPLLESGLRLANELAGYDEPVLFAPNLPGLYPCTERHSPIRQLQFIFPMELNRESATIREVEEGNVQWVMLRDYATAGRDDLRFRHTNPLLFAHFNRYFAPYQMPGLPPDTIVLRRTTRQRP